MLRGLGIDLIETSRLARALERHGAAFERRVFTDGELADCRDRQDRIQALAARFAAKEACFKALGTGWSGGVGWREVEVVRDRAGPPALRLSGVALRRATALGVREIYVSLTHQASTAAAVVVFEG